MSYYKCFFGITLLFLGVSLGFAEKSLQEIIEIAQKNAEQLEIIDLSHEAAEHEINLFKASAYPQLMFSTEGAYTNTSLYSFGAMGEGFGEFFSLPYKVEMLKRELDSIKGISSPNNQSGQGNGNIFSGARFDGTQYNWALSFEQPLITFGRLKVVYRMAGEQQKLIGKTRAMQREQFFIGVVQAYNQAVVAKVRLEVASKGLEIYEKLHKTIEIDFNTGARPRIDYLQAEAMLARANAEKQMAFTQNEVAINRLKVLIGLKEHDDLALSISEEMYPEYIYRSDQETAEAPPRATRIKDLNVKLAFDLARYEKSKRWPTVNLTGLVHNNVEIVGTDGSGSADLVDMGNPEFFNYKVGLKLTWPLFNGYRTMSSYKKARAQAQIEKRRYSQMKKNDNIRLDEARKLVSASAQSVQAAAKARNASVLAFDQSKTDLSAGRINISQFTEVERQYKENQMLYYKAKADELMAHLNFKLTLGKALFE